MQKRVKNRKSEPGFFLEFSPGSRIVIPYPYQMPYSLFCQIQAKPGHNNQERGWHLGTYTMFWVECLQKEQNQLK